MVDFAIQIAINAAALLVATRIVPKLSLPFGPSLSDWSQVIAVAFLFGVVNSYLRPILRILSLPLSLVTLGAVGFVINLGLFLLVGFISGLLKLGFSIAGWPTKGPITVEVILTALLASVVMSIAATVLSLLLSGRRIVRL